MVYLLCISGSLCFFLIISVTVVPAKQ